MVRGNDGNLWKRFQVEDVEEAKRIALEASLEDIDQVNIIMISAVTVKGQNFKICN